MTACEEVLMTVFALPLGCGLGYLVIRLIGWAARWEPLDLE